VAEERRGDGKGGPGVVPLIIGGGGGGTAATGRHRSLTTLSLKGIPAEQLDGFTSSLQALGFRVTRNGMKLVVPAKDRNAVLGIIDLERLKADTATRRVDDRWWYSLVDAADDLAEADPDELDEEPVERFLAAHATFVRRGLQASFRAELLGHVLGLAEATATHLGSGRPDLAVACAARLSDAGRRLR
jgi:hypothetical protein